MCVDPTFPVVQMCFYDSFYTTNRSKFFQNRLMGLLYRLNTLTRLILDGVIDVHDRQYAVCSPLSLSLSLSLSFLSESFTPFEHSSSGETCFSKLFYEPLKNFRWLDPFCNNKFDNNALLHANRHFLFIHLSCRA